MVNLSQFVGVKINDEVDISDLYENPENHYWEVSFEFPQEEYRGAYETPTGKRYGSGSSFAQIYSFCKQPFLDIYFNTDYFYSDVKSYGDSLIRNLNRAIGINVENLINEQDNVFTINKNVEINEKRYNNLYYKYEKALQQFSELGSWLSDLYDSIPLTKKGNIDHRTRAYREYINAQQAQQDKATQVEKLEKRLYSETKRFDNSLEKQRNAENNLQQLKAGTLQNIRNMYQEESEYFAERVKEDIIAKAESGVLPVQNLPLMEATIRKRKYVGLSAYPRFWATGQLIRSIIIVCILR